MRYNKLGRSGLLVSELCLGTMTFGEGSGMWSAVASVAQQGAEAPAGFDLFGGERLADHAFQGTAGIPIPTSVRLGITIPTR